MARRLSQKNNGNGLSYFHGEVTQGEVNHIQSVGITNLWHSRFWHMNSKNMEILHKEGYVVKKDLGSLEFCEGSVLAKSHKQSFPTNKHTTKGIFDFVHSDFWRSLSKFQS